MLPANKLSITACAGEVITPKISSPFIFVLIDTAIGPATPGIPKCRCAPVIAPLNPCVIMLNFILEKSFERLNTPTPYALVASGGVF